MDKKRKVVSDFLKVYSSKLFSQSLGFVRSIIVAKYLGPLNFGYWKAIELIMEYHRFSSLGTQDAMSRDIAHWSGRGDYHKAQALENTAFTHIFGLPLAVSVVIFSLSFFFSENELLAFSLRIVSSITLLCMITTYYQLVLSSKKMFGLISRMSVIYSVIFFLANVLLVVRFGYKGHMWSLLLAYLVLLGLNIYFYRPKYLFVYKASVVFELIKVGFPLMMVSLVHTLLVTVDRMIILKYLGVKQLGYYSLALIATRFLLPIPQWLATVIYPRLNERYGATNDVRSLRNLALKPTWCLSLVMAILMGSIILFIGDLVQLFLTKYSNGILSAQILVIGISYVSIDVLRTINKQSFMLLIQLAALFFNVTLSIVLVKLGYGIVGIAVGTSVAFIFYKIFLTNLSLKFLEIKKRDRFVIALQLGAPFTYILFSVTVILKIAGLETATSVKEILLKVISYSVVCLPLLFVLLSNMKKEGLLFGCRLCRRTP